jgi:hypothetical protein
MYGVTHTGNAGKYEVELDGVILATFDFWGDAWDFMLDHANAESDAEALTKCSTLS